MRWTAEQLPDLTGRTAAVTGANSGIGWHTAFELARHGAHVILACRDVERGKQAADRIRSRVAAADVEVAELNLASMDSVRAFGTGWTDPLDILINNAGVMAPPKRVRTQDGYELQWGTNHLGHFVLTGLLLPALLSGTRARVVTVASIAHKSANAGVLSANNDEPYQPHQAYANSKLANLLFAIELHRKLVSHELAVTSVAAHPGLAATGLISDPEGAGSTRLGRNVAPALAKVFAQPAAAGARPVLYAATLAAPGSYTGPQRLHETRGDLGPARMSTWACDPSLAKQLWITSEAMTGFRYPWPS
ncbi:MAG TPA: oxidoreductase [Jatrophihabitantaceae bacterium]|nr:oxidoreductase [Jatrophihabitantaceae bacterium]